MDENAMTVEGPLPVAAARRRAAVISVDAAVSIAKMRNLHGAAGMPGPAPGAEQIPDLLEQWRSAGVGLVRTYDWVSRLDTVDNPSSLFPKWSADPGDPSSYNFEATDAWIKQVHDIGAEVLFTIASAVPSNKRPAGDLVVYEQVVENIVRHYVNGWGGGGFVDAITHWEFGDQPDFGSLHFDGSPEEFFEMYAAASRAVKRVGAHLQFGGPCAAFPLNEGLYREGFLERVSQRALPLDFLTFMWFADGSRDPLDFRVVAREVRELLDRNGFEKTLMILAYWNMTGIPNAQFTSPDAAAFHAAAAVYMQDSVIDRAILFRADTGTDLHYQFVDPAGIFGVNGCQNEKTESFRLVGRTLAARERLQANGGDDNGFAILAGRTDAADVVRILICNYAIPAAYLTPRDEDVLTFKVPIGSVREDMSLSVPPRRTNAAGSNVINYSLEVVNLPWGDGPHRVARYRIGSADYGEVIDLDNHGHSIIIHGQLVAPTVELVEIRQIVKS